ncbi:hypothetical protein CJ179_30850 [Rhodococcus sp. ACS1]|nr:hypothetical protein CJ179_30850 [Rhodococcus sp. ACS1]
MALIGTRANHRTGGPGVGFTRYLAPTASGRGSPLLLGGGGPAVEAPVRVHRRAPPTDGGVAGACSREIPVEKNSEPRIPFTLDPVCGARTSE